MRRNKYEEAAKLLRKAARLVEGLELSPEEIDRTLETRKGESLSLSE